MSEWIESGQPAPDFALPADEGPHVTLKSLRGSPVVLYFYPKDDTPGCTVEAQAFRDHMHRLAQLGAKVVGVSPDSVESHRKFRDKYALNFRLLSDVGHQVAERFGAWGEKVRDGRRSMGIRRSTFLIDSDGMVRKVWKDVKPANHAQETIEALEELHGAKV